MGQLNTGGSEDTGAARLGRLAPAIVVLGPGALNTARRVKTCLPGSSIHGLAKRIDSTDADIAFTELGPHLRALYRSGTPIVGLCAAGILIRCLAQVIGERLTSTSDGAAKTTEPPVLAIAEDGSAVVPLLGGLGGVNTMARTIADALAVRPAITTSGELRFGACLLDPPAGYALADLEHGKRFVSDLLAGERTRVDGVAPWLDATDLPRDPQAQRSIRVSVNSTPDPDTLLIHPRAVIVALDIDADTIIGPVTSATDIAHRVETALTKHDIARQALAAIVLDARHLGHDALEQAASILGTALRFADVSGDDKISLGHGNKTNSTATDAQPTHHLADIVRHRLNTASLIREHDGITLFIAKAPIDNAALSLIGRRRGSLTVVGLGPGAKALLAPAASDALAHADDVLGYATYVEMAGPFDAWQLLHPSDNREELQRARHAFELAGTGRDVVIVSSGDPGIFAMAAAVLEALEASSDARWSAVRLEIIPGISAAMAGAAVAGAPLGHDFCLLSLSDNLKPWAVIEHRLLLAAQADLVIAFYNPISRARPWQLERAFEIVRGVRAANTPVVLGRDIGRPGGTLKTVSLGAVTADQVDMRTVVIIGSSTTRDFTTADGRQWIYTPRWYPSAH